MEAVKTLSTPHPHQIQIPPQTVLMAATTSPLYLLATAVAVSLPLLSSAVVSQCSTAQFGNCYDRPAALLLKLIAIVSILIASTIGVSLPLFSRSVPMLRPDRNLFVVVKAFASGVILATGFMHVLPDSFEMLMSPCLLREPWHKFPFTTFIAMLSAIFTLMVDSFMMTFQGRKGCAEVADHDSPLASNAPPQVVGHGHGHCVNMSVPLEVDSKTIDESTLLRNRIVAQVLEMGIVVHSVVIGLSMGASQNVCTIRPLVAALCFHQLFEGMGLGGCILQAEYTLKIKATMVFFFSTTTPIRIALGIGLSNIYSDSSPTALIVVGALNASSAGLLIYMALVDLLAADFLGPRLQKSARLQGWAYVAVLLGAGGMSLMAKWA